MLSARRHGDKEYISEHVLLEEEIVKIGSSQPTPNFSVDLCSVKTNN